MSDFVKCWHCTHYIWFSVNYDNSLAICDIKKQCVSSEEKVCEKFIRNNGIYTKKAIPDYCIHYKH